MKRLSLILFAMVLAAGCNDNKSTPSATQSTPTPVAAKTTGTASEADDIQANLAKLSPEDRALAEKQKECVESEGSLLGSMGVPIKVMVKGEPVFVCCGHCVKHVKEEPDKALAKAKELREKNSKK